jgi:hypothetical protein
VRFEPRQGRFHLPGRPRRGTEARRRPPLRTQIRARALVTDRYPLDRIAEAFAHAALETAITPGAA